MRLKSVLTLPLLLAASQALALSSSVRVVGIHVDDRNLESDWNAAGARWGGEMSCRSFQGTHAGNEVYLRVDSDEYAGRVRHTLSYEITDDFVTTDKKGKYNSLGTHVLDVDEGDTFKIRIPELKPYVRTKVMLYLRLHSQDSNGPDYAAHGGLKIAVSRPLYLTRALGTKAEANACRQTLPAVLTQIGDQTNLTSSESNLTIEQALENSTTETNGWKWGIYFSPMAWAFNLFSLNIEYFHQVSKQVTETVHVSNTFNLKPGDAMRIYKQEARVVEPFDATLVDPCGGEIKEEAAYYIQKWQTSYHVYPIMRNGKDEISGELPGLEPYDSCSSKEVNTYNYEDGASWKNR